MKKETLDRIYMTLGALTVLMVIAAIYGLWTLDFALLGKLAAVWITVVILTGIALASKGGP